jgi:hypothetical protein
MNDKEYIPHTVSLDDFDELGAGFPSDGEGLDYIVKFDDGVEIGFGYDADLRLIGWRRGTRYELTVRDSLEWYITITSTANALGLSASNGTDAFQAWLAQILKAVIKGEVVE